MAPGRDLASMAVEQEQGSLDSDCRMETAGKEWQHRYACGYTSCNSSPLPFLTMQKGVLISLKRK